MKKILCFTFLLFSAFSFGAINAAEIDLYNQDQEFYHFKLLASDLPNSNINSVKVVLTVENAEITKLADFENENIIFTSKDCENSEYFTAKSLCFTLLFSSPIQNGDVLADFSVERTSFDYSMRVKIGGDSTYSDGNESYKIDKTLYEDIVLKDEEDGIIELEITPEELSGNTSNENETPTVIDPPVQANDTNSVDSMTTIAAVLLGILLLLTLIALTYFLLKPKSPQVPQ